MSADPLIPSPRSPSTTEGPDLARRVALSIKEAATALGVSERHLRSILPEIPTVRLGTRTLIPIDALKRWLEAEVSRPEQHASRRADDILAGFE